MNLYAAAIAGRVTGFSSAHPRRFLLSFGKS
jgi:hypothetical protein